MGHLYSRTAKIVLFLFFFYPFFLLGYLGMHNNFLLEQTMLVLLVVFHCSNSI